VPGVSLMMVTSLCLVMIVCLVTIVRLVTIVSLVLGVYLVFIVCLVKNAYVWPSIYQYLVKYTFVPTIHQLFQTLHN